MDLESGKKKQIKLSQIHTRENIVMTRNADEEFTLGRRGTYTGESLKMTNDTVRGKCTGQTSPRMKGTGFEESSTDGEQCPSPQATPSKVSLRTTYTKATLIPKRSSQTLSKSTKTH